MYGSGPWVFSFWWIIPIVMMILCFFMMCGRKRTIMGGFGPCNRNWHQTKRAETPMDILDRRYASGDIEKAEYEEIKRTLFGPTGTSQIER